MSHLKFLFVTFFVFAGFDYNYGQLELYFTAKYRSNHYPLDSIIIENINTGSRIIKYYPDTMLQLVITGSGDIRKQGGSELKLCQNYPNPFKDRTDFNIYMPRADLLTIHVYNIQGKELLQFEKNMPAGCHSFTFTGPNETIYFLTAGTRNYSKSIRMIQAGGSIRPSGLHLYYQGFVPGNDEDADPNGTLKNNNSDPEYHQGDLLRLTGFITNDTGAVVSDTIIHSPTVSKTYTFQFEKTNRIVILMYHELVNNEPGNEYERNVTDFENDLVYLRNNYQIFSMEDLLMIDTGALQLNSDAVIITFDDGYHSDHSMAFPLLAGYDLPATFFIVAEWVDSIDYMIWPEVYQLSQYVNGEGKRLFNVSSHTSSHPYLEKSAQYFDDHQDYLNFLYTELADSKNWIVDITGRPDIFLSLPFGDGAYNADIIQTAKYCGYLGIRTSEYSSFTADEMDLFALPAIPVLDDTTIDIIETYFNY